MARPVGGSSEPAITLVASPPIRRQNKFEPQRLQNPRSACGDERYQVSPSDEINDRFADGALVAATKWPLARRHCEQ